MKPIILASASKQRAKLLRLTGLKFKVRPSNSKEIHKIKTNCADLVKENALLKAEATAGGLRKGIVISADTVVFGGRKIIGKPADLKEAKRILRRLGRRPHWVYTGLAVLDVESKKTLVDYEKTKVHMLSLSDEEINRYHRRTPPFDKAGGFDIEGLGGVFINRIEGCYSNVIGLPLAKLRLMLKRFGVNLLCLFLLVLTSGCATEYNLATGKEESLMYGTDKEIAVGEAVARQLEANFKISDDWESNHRVDEILKKIEPASDRHDLVYIIKVIDDPTLNAVSLPGGYIYVFKGLLDKVKNDGQLAGVIAHEMGHITAKHAIKRMQAAYGMTVLQILAVTSGDAQVAQGANLIFASVFLAYSRQDEFQADELGVKYMTKGGYDPQDMIGVLRLLQKEEERMPASNVNYFRTHPYLSERISVVNKTINGRIDFRDYLNLTGNES